MASYGSRPAPLFALVLATLVGCVTTNPRHPSDYPTDHRRPTPVLDKSEDEKSQVWPLGAWLDEFARRNGVAMAYDDRDVLDIEVVRPSPGPYASDADARAALERVVREYDLVLIEEKPHAFRVRRTRAYVR